MKTGCILVFDHEQIKTGGFLPALIAAIPTILSWLEGIGGIGSAAAAITNAVKTAKHQSAEEEEAKRHNLEMEKLAKEKQTGSGLKKIIKKEPLTNFDIIKLVKDLKIKHFRDIFMKDDIPKK